MSKRFTSTEKWSDPWFVDLSVEAKCLFLFLCDHCNIAGFYEKSDRVMQFYLGMSKEQISQTTDEIKKSVPFVDGFYFLKNFIRHQKNTPLNPENNCHKSIIYELQRMSDRFYEFYPDEIKGYLCNCPVEISMTSAKKDYEKRLASERNKIEKEMLADIAKL